MRVSADRRKLLKALGFGSLFPAFSRPAKASASVPPPRVVFFIQPHGHVPKGWTFPNIPTANVVVQRPINTLKVSDFNVALQSLHPFREKLLAVEGLCHTSVQSDVVAAAKNGGDPNNHNLAVSGLLTAAPAKQTPGFACTGGSRSIDQELAIRTAGAGRFASRVYGYDYLPNGAPTPFSFLDSAKPAPMVTDPSAAFTDLLGLTPSGLGKTTPAQEKIRSLRSSVLDSVAEEFAFVAQNMSTSDRQKLLQHQSLIRDLELGISANGASQCELSMDAKATRMQQFMRLMRLGLACDLTRVITFVAPVPQPTEFGYPAEANVHADYAHAAIAGKTSCGQMFTQLAEKAMIDLDTWYASHFAALLRELDSVPEGNGTLLDHTVVVWLTELGLPTHQHESAHVMLAGGCNGFLRTGSCVRYPQIQTSPIKNAALSGPAHNRLFVSLLNAMGQSDQTFGQTSAQSSDGKPISFAGALDELHT
jgi:hypothetical protein